MNIANWFIQKLANKHHLPGKFVKMSVEIAVSIEEALLAKSASKGWLSEQLGIPEKRVKHYLSGRYDFDIQEIIALETVLGLQLLYTSEDIRIIINDFIAGQTLIENTEPKDGK